MSDLILVDPHLGKSARLAEVVAMGAGPDASVIRVGDPDTRSAMLRDAVDARKVA